MRVVARRQRTSREAGFTIVESLVAALVVTAVFAGAIYFVAGAGKSQQKSLVRQRMAAAADSITQKVRADREWLTTNPGCARAACDVSRLFQPPAPRSEGPRLTSDVDITPVDGEGDLTGPNDEDHITPDFYRIQVRVSLASGEAQKWGEQKAFETVSTVDATALGRATGSLVVQVGQTTNQVDDRMSISSTTAAASEMEMNPQPEPCSNPFPMTWAEWQPARRPMLPMGCNDSLESARSKDPFMSSVRVTPARDVSFRLRRITTDGGPGTTRTWRDADSSAGDGTYVFSGLPAGTYTIEATPPAGRELWTSKMVPSDGKVGVQANQEARALVMVRPKQGVGNYDIKVSRTVYLYWLGTDTSSFTDTWTEHDATFQTVTTYVYLTGEGPRREEWGGPAWDGIVAMETKPFDRWRNGSGVAPQQAMYIPWNGTAGENSNGLYRFAQLATGLHSAPKLQPAPQPVPSDRWGSWGSRDMDCYSARTPGGACGDFAWIDHRPATLGQPNSMVSWHSNDGECYLQSSVGGYRFARQPQLGPGHDERCSRDLVYRNPDTGKVTRVKDFLPDKNGNGGGRMVLSMSSVTSCIANCGLVPPPPATATFGAQDPVADGPRPSAAPKSNPNPPSPPQEKPVMNIVRPASGGGTQSMSTSAAPAMPLANTGPNP